MFYTPDEILQMFQTDNINDTHIAVTMILTPIISLFFTVLMYEIFKNKNKNRTLGIIFLIAFAVLIYINIVTFINSETRCLTALQDLKNLMSAFKVISDKKESATPGFYTGVTNI